MRLDEKALLELCDLVSVATACGPAVGWVERRLSGWQFDRVEDGCLLARAPGARDADVRVLYVAHVDEIGGMVLHERPDGWATRTIGVAPARLAGCALVAMDYLDETGASLRPAEGLVVDDELVLRAEGLSPLGAVFTYAERARIEDGWIHGKAIDPRLTAFAVVEAARQLASPAVAAMVVFAEECSMHAAKKGAHLVSRRLPNVELVANADVPGLANLTGCPLDRCALRVAEGGSLIDPHFGLRLHRALTERGLRIALAHARSGSQTPLFIPLAHAISLALPAAEAHVTPTHASLGALRDLIDVLLALPELALS